MKIQLPGSSRSVSVGKLLCIGRNYADHAEEMAREVPEEPLVFLKPASALIRSGAVIQLPIQSQDIHHEVELVAVIGRKGKDIPQRNALAHVAAYAVGLDMTARDLQSEAKKQGHPWSIAKGFDTFAPLGPLRAASSVEDPQNLRIRLEVNGDIRQNATTRSMMFPVSELIHYCSQIFTLNPGDLLYTGTPSGVGPVEDGDVLRATAGWGALRASVCRGT